MAARSRNFAQTFSTVNGISGIRMHIRAAGDARVQGDPPGIASHDFNHHHAAMGFGRCVKAVDGVGGDMQGGVKSERHLRG